MKYNVTPNLSILDDDQEIQKRLTEIRSRGELGSVQSKVMDGNYDWFMIVFERTSKEDGNVLFFQHFGLEGDEGFALFELKEIVKNRHELDTLASLLESHHKVAKIRGERGTFHLKCANMVKGLRNGVSLFELMKKGILHTPPPSLN